MEDIEKIVNGIDLDDLLKRELCYFCIASGMTVQDSLHNPDDMREGPITSDMKCPHCYDTEEESGRFGLSRVEKKYASRVLWEFKKYKKKRLGFY